MMVSQRQGRSWGSGSINFSLHLLFINVTSGGRPWLVALDVDPLLENLGSHSLLPCQLLVVKDQVIWIEYAPRNQKLKVPYHLPYFLESPEILDYLRHSYLWKIL